VVTGTPEIGLDEIDRKPVPARWCAIGDMLAHFGRSDDRFDILDAEIHHRLGSRSRANAQA
jgi:hypothetical protein